MIYIKLIINTLLGIFGIILEQLNVNFLRDLRKIVVHHWVMSCALTFVSFIAIFGFVSDTISATNFSWSLIRWSFGGADEIRTLPTDYNSNVMDEAPFQPAVRDVDIGIEPSDDVRARSPAFADNTSGWVHFVETDAAGTQLFKYDNESFSLGDDYVSVSYSSDTDRSSEDKYAPLLLFRRLSGVIDKGFMITFNVKFRYPVYRPEIGGDGNTFGVAIFNSEGIIPKSGPRYNYLQGLTSRHYIGASLTIKPAEYSQGSADTDTLFYSSKMLAGRGFSNAFIEGSANLRLSGENGSAQVDLEVNPDGFWDLSVSVGSETKTATGRLQKPFPWFDALMVWLPRYSTPAWEVGGFDVAVSDIRAFEVD